MWVSVGLAETVSGGLGVLSVALCMPHHVALWVDHFGRANATASAVDCRHYCPWEARSCNLHNFLR